MYKRLSFALLALAFGTALSACLDDSITGTRPLSMVITVDQPTALVDSTVTARYEATGTGLLGVIINWGDGVVDSLALSGTVVTISGPADHVYTAAGSYDIVGTVQAQNGIQTSQTSIQIN